MTEPYFRDDVRASSRISTACRPRAPTRCNPPGGRSSPPKDELATVTGASRPGSAGEIPVRPFDEAGRAMRQAAGRAAYASGG